MKKIILGLMLLMSAAPLGGCSVPREASDRALEGMGFTEVRTKYDLIGLACSDGDSWARKFTGKGRAGRPVSGTVCGSYLTKGTTVRFD